MQDVPLKLLIINLLHSQGQLLWDSSQQIYKNSHSHSNPTSNSNIYHNSRNSLKPLPIYLLPLKPNNSRFLLLIFLLLKLFNILSQCSQINSFQDQHLQQLIDRINKNNKYLNSMVNNYLARMNLQGRVFESIRCLQTSPIIPINNKSNLNNSNTPVSTSLVSI